MATHSSVLAWRIPGMGEPGGLPSTGSHRVTTEATQQQQDSYALILPEAAAAAKWLQSCPTLCDPIDGSPSGS